MTDAKRDFLVVVVATTDVLLVEPEVGINLAESLEQLQRQFLVPITIGEEDFALSTILGYEVPIRVIGIGRGQHLGNLAHKLTGTQFGLSDGT